MMVYWVWRHLDVLNETSRTLWILPWVSRLIFQQVHSLSLKQIAGTYTLRSYIHFSEVTNVKFMKYKSHLGYHQSKQLKVKVREYCTSSSWVRLLTWNLWLYNYRTFKVNQTSHKDMQKNAEWNNWRVTEIHFATQFHLQFTISWSSSSGYVLCRKLMSYVINLWYRM